MRIMNRKKKRVVEPYKRDVCGLRCIDWVRRDTDIQLSIGKDERK